ncbi:MAG: hypothetical protein ABIL00_06020 [candidate division WOR-3 bacterium]
MKTLNSNFLELSRSPLAKSHSPLAKSRLKEADKTFIIIRKEIEEGLSGN